MRDCEPLQRGTWGTVSADKKNKSERELLIIPINTNCLGTMTCCHEENMNKFKYLSYKMFYLYLSKTVLNKIMA
jgi:hypothetical protein